MNRACIPGAILAGLAVWLWGCQSGSVDMAGGLSEILDRGVHVSYSWSSEELWNNTRIGVLPGGTEKMRGPVW